MDTHVPCGRTVSAEHKATAATQEKDQAGISSWEAQTGDCKTTRPALNRSLPPTRRPPSSTTCPAPLPAADAPTAGELPAKDPLDEAENIIATLLGMGGGDVDGSLGGSGSEASTDGDSGSDAGTDEELYQSTRADGLGAVEDDAPAGAASTSDDVKCVTKNLTFDWDAYRTKFGDTPYDVAVTQMFVRYAQLVDRLTGSYHCRPPMSVAEAEEVAALARSFVLDFLTPLLGQFFSTKVHKLLAHVLAAIRLHGAVKNGDTGGNESLHGHEKRRYVRTNRDEDTFRGQLLRIGQGSLEIRARFEREAADYDAWFDDGDEAEAAGAPQAPPAPPPRLARHGVAPAALAATAGVPDVGPVRRRPGRRAPAVTVAELSMRPGLCAVRTALGLPLVTTILRLPSSYTFSPRFPCCSGGHPLQHLRATPMYRGLPWFDCLAYALPGDAQGVVRYGEARAIVSKAGDNDVNVVIVAAMDVCESMPGCPLVEGGCTRLCWSMELGDEWPALLAVPLSSVLRLEHAVPDQDQITRDHGITATPVSVPNTPENRRAQRFFVNAFYPWS